MFPDAIFCLSAHVQRWVRHAVIVMAVGHSVCFASNLPAEHESVRLMLALESSVEKQRWAKANDLLAELEALETRLEPDFHYFNGLVLFKRNQYAAAKKSLEVYVVKAGHEGQYYIDALKLITELEDQAQDLDGGHESSQPAAASILHADEGGDGYVRSLQSLYLSDSPVAALETHINSLLASHAYSEGRLKTLEQKSGVRYSINVDGASLVISEKNFREGKAALSVSRLSILGIDPFLRFACSNSEYLCWIYHPADAHERWLLLERDELAAKELSEALSKLIRLLQR